MTRRYLVAIGAGSLLLTQTALGHPGHAIPGGLAAGWAHPFSGIDHLLAMVAIGLLAVQRGGRATWLLPATFIGFMVAGGLLALGGVSIPLVEHGVMASVLVLGVFIALFTQIPPSALIVLPCLFAVCHGYAHVAEMNAGTSPFAYALGFVLATAILHAMGIGLGMAARRLATWPIARIAGAAIAVCGALLFVHML